MCENKAFQLMTMHNTCKPKTLLSGSKSSRMVAEL